MLVVIESEYSFLNRPGLLDPRPGEGPGSLHFYQEMLLLWSGDPAVRTAVLEEDEEAETGARPPISGKERDWRSSLADSCCPKAGLGAKVHAVRVPGSMPCECGPAGPDSPHRDSQALQPQRGPVSLLHRLGH